MLVGYCWFSASTVTTDKYEIEFDPTGRGYLQFRFSCPSAVEAVRQLQVRSEIIGDLKAAVWIPADFLQYWIIVGAQHQ
jgi:hypothetical protein